MIGYFITGATGAVGSALVERLVADPGIRVYLLIRGGSEADSAQRVAGLFRYWGLPVDDETLGSRVRAVRGDMSEPRLGMNPHNYAEVVRQCSRIVHAGGNVRMNLPIDAARHSSVDSMSHIVRLANDCLTLEKVDVVSTVGVGGRLTPVPAAWLDEPRSFHNTYEQAKAEAEDLLREQIERHRLPATLHRPSMVVGDAESGKIIHFQIFYYLCEFLSGRQTFGIVPNLAETQLDTVPVDYVARALQWSSTQTTNVGEVMHLCSGPEYALTILRLVEEVRSAMISHGIELPMLRLVPERLFSRLVPILKLAAPKKHRKALQTLSLFMDYAAGRQQFENSTSRQRLGDAGIDLPQPEDYLSKLLGYYLRNKST